MNILKDRKAKLESAYSFMLIYSKTTVCIKEDMIELMKIATSVSSINDLI